MMKRVSHICWLLLAVLQVASRSSAQGTTVSPANTTVTLTSRAPYFIYIVLPVDVAVAVGEPVVFRCGVLESKNFTFSYHSSHGNYSLTCPHGHVEDIPQALHGSCEVKDHVSFAIWTLKGTSYSDNNARIICQQSNDPQARVSILHVYDNGASCAVLISCVIGGFFGILLVFGLLFILLRKSEGFQLFFGGADTEDDFDTIIKM